MTPETRASQVSWDTRRLPRSRGVVLGLGEARGKVPVQVQLEPIAALHGIMGVSGCP